MKNSIKVFAPATVANLSAGFDVLGLALHQPGDEVEMSLNNANKVIIEKITGDQGKLSLNPEKNTVGSVVIDYLKQRDLHVGVTIKLHKKMPFGSGLGSSSASAVAGLMAINELVDQPLKKINLLPLAMEGERVACGTAHADNVAPSLLGGVTLIRSYHPLDVVQLPYPKDLFIGLVYSHVNIPTAEARKIIKSKIFLKDAITQWGNVAGLVSGFCLQDNHLIGRSLHDVIIEPSRAVLIPFFYEMKEMALQNQALGFGISGSGPTVFALYNDENTAQLSTKKIQTFLKQHKVTSDIFVSTINNNGAIII